VFVSLAYGIGDFSGGFEVSAVFVVYGVFYVSWLVVAAYIITALSRTSSSSSARNSSASSSASSGVCVWFALIFLTSLPLVVCSAIFLVSFGGA
jgi:hypothetical protein